MYEALLHGAFVVHNSVPGIEAHLSNGTHLVLFDAEHQGGGSGLGADGEPVGAQAMAGLAAVLTQWLSDDAARARAEIRREGQRHVVAHHTQQARVEALLRAVARGEGGRQLGATPAAASDVSDKTVLDSLAVLPGLERGGGGGGGGGAGKGAASGVLDVCLAEDERERVRESAGWEQVRLDEVVEGGEKGVSAWRVAKSVFAEEERSVRAVRALPDEEDDFRVSKLEHLRRHVRIKDGPVTDPELGGAGAGGRDEGMQLLALDDVTVSSGGVLCNATHVFHTFSIHGELMLGGYGRAAGPGPPGCFGREAARVVRVGDAIFLPTRWGNSWQHFIQDATFRLVFALHALPEAALERSHLILETKSSRNLLAVAAALMGGRGPERVLYVDTGCMSNIHFDFRPKGRVLCRRHPRAGRLYVKLSCPRRMNVWMRVCMHACMH